MGQSAWPEKGEAAVEESVAEIFGRTLANAGLVSNKFNG
jgi:hypothetical protein